MRCLFFSKPYAVVFFSEYIRLQVKSDDQFDLCYSNDESYDLWLHIMRLFWGEFRDSCGVVLG